MSSAHRWNIVWLIVMAVSGVYAGQAWQEGDTIPAIVLTLVWAGAVLGILIPSLPRRHS